jgi:hypothetical protein
MRKARQPPCGARRVILANYHKGKKRGDSYHVDAPRPETFRGAGPRPYRKCGATRTPGERIMNLFLGLRVLGWQRRETPWMGVKLPVPETSRDAGHPSGVALVSGESHNAG